MKKFCIYSLLIVAITTSQTKFDAYSAEDLEESEYVLVKKEVVKKNEAKKATPESYYQEGRASYLKFNMKGYQDSIVAYNKALKIDRNFAKALAAKAEAQALTSRLIYESTGDIKESAKFESQAFENAFIAQDINPNIKETHRALSTVYFIQKKYEEGKEEANKALKIDSNDAESNLFLWLNSPDYKLIRKDNPDETYYKSLNLDSETLDKVFEKDPDLIIAYFERARAMSHQDEYFKAVKNYKKIIELNPENEEAYITLGNLYIDSADHDKAVENFEKALEIDPDRYDALYNLGITYLKKRNSVISQEYLNKACDYDYMDSCELANGKSMRPYRRTPRMRRQFNQMLMNSQSR